MTEPSLRFFAYEHLPAGRMRETSSRFASLAREVETAVRPGPERGVALRKLLEAKDAAVRAVMQDIEADEAKNGGPGALFSHPSEPSESRDLLGR